MKLYRIFLATAVMALAVAGHAQGAAMNAPDDTKPQQITGCMTAKTRSGGYILSGVFGKPVTVIGPNYLQVGLGHQVTLTGTWQANGIAPENDKANDSRMFVATAVKVTARQCVSPPSALPPPRSGL